MVLANKPRHPLRVASGLVLLLIFIFACFESKLISQELQNIFPQNESDIFELSRDQGKA